VRPRIGLIGSLSKMIISGLASLMTGEDQTALNSEEGHTKKSNVLYELIMEEFSELYFDSLYLAQTRSIIKNYPNVIKVVLHLLSYVSIALFCKRLWNYFWKLVKVLSS
jgi:hypothetical protein